MFESQIKITQFFLISIRYKDPSKNFLNNQTKFPILITVDYNTSILSIILDKISSMHNTSNMNMTPLFITINI